MDQVLRSNTAQEGAPAYEYEPLDLTKPQIRLIVLHPCSSTNPSDPIMCDIKTFDTETEPHYIALSYTWGPVNPQRTILINGRSLSIRQNLYDFLHRYRNDWRNKHELWIDQICISQAHAGERNHQVRLMSQIYSHSLSTIIWLGKSSREAALRYQGNRGVDDIFTLFRNRYFTRLWVVQEILLSPHKRILCDDVWLGFDDLVRAMEYSSASRFPPLEFVNLQYYENTSHGKGNETLKDCIRRFSGYDCEDPRDKVYGILSLVRENDRLEVDYSKSTEEVFLQVVTSNVPWTYLPSSLWQDVYPDIPQVTADRFGDDIDIDSMVNLSVSMGLHEHQAVLREFLEEIRDCWASGRLKKIEAGFQRRIPQTKMRCLSRDHAERGCCSDRWWFLLDGIKHYRDQESYGGGGFIHRCIRSYRRTAANRYKHENGEISGVFQL
jgi:hypothetical protein